MPKLLSSLDEALTVSIYEQKIVLSANEIEVLKPELKYCKYDASSEVFAYHAQANAIYFVVSGCVLIYEKMPDGKVMAFDKIHRGGFFGEVGTLYGGVRTAAAYALERTELLALDPNDLASFLKKHPDVGKLMMKGMAERLNRSAKDLLYARLRDVDLINIDERTHKDRIIIFAGNFLGSGGFLILFFALLGMWSWAHHTLNTDPNMAWVALTLSIVQIVISNLVLKSQLHAAKLESHLIAREREANLKAEQEIHNLHPKLDENILELITRLDEIRKRLDDK